MLRQVLVLVAGVVLAGCQIESRAAMTVNSIRATGSSGATTPVIVDIAVQYPNRNFCTDYWKRTQEVLRKQFGEARFVECKRVGRKEFGYYKIPTQLVRTPADGSAREQVLGGKIAAFGVYDDPRKGGGFVVGGIIRQWKFQDLKKAIEALYKLPEQRVLFQVRLLNDSGAPVGLKMDRVILNGTPVTQPSQVTLQPGKSVLVAFSPEKLAAIRRQGFELLFTVLK